MSRTKKNCYSPLASGLIASKYRSSGQTCICANRVYVQSSVMDKFAKTLAANIDKTMKQGPVWDRSVNFGPLYSNKGIAKVREHVKDALSHGAKIACGGDADYKSEELGPNFFPPTVLTGAKKDMMFCREETFGPLSALVPFDTEEEVIKLANEVDVGLAAYFYTENITRMWRVAEALEAGMVGCRVGLISASEQPFGGIKESGLGREGSRFALEEYLNIKSITIGGLE